MPEAPSEHPEPRSYKLSLTSRKFTSCAFGTGAPAECPSDSSLTAHPTLMNKTMGVLGYGHIGEVRNLQHPKYVLDLEWSADWFYDGWFQC